MTNVSKRRVKKEIFESISKQFIKYVSNLDTSEKTKNVLSELLTDTERVMLFKRFMAIVMLGRNYSFVDIEEVLKLSPTTISRLQREMKRGDYDYILEQMPEKSSSKIEIKKSYKERRELGVLETILRAGMPPIVGPGRWSGGPYASAVKGTRRR